MNKEFKLIVKTLMFVFFISLAKAGDVPSYNEILAQQLKCNSQYFSGSIWNKKLPILAKMNSSKIVIISKPTIMELPTRIYQNVKQEQKNAKEKNFKVNAISYSFFECGQKKPLLESMRGGAPVETLINISEDKAGSGIFQIIGGEPEDFASADPKINSDFLYYAGDNVSEFGMYCVVFIDNFLKNPNAINIDKLCAGKTAKDREETKKAIEQVRQVLKKAVVK